MQCPQCGKAASPNAKFCPACGARLGGGAPPVQRLQPGQLLHNGAYRIQRTLGKGGMGLVYLAENMQAFGRLCVVKEMLDYFDPNDPHAVTAAHQRFEDEARTLSRLNHPGIPGIQAYFSEGGHNYMVMSYVAGDNLEQMLGQQIAERQIIEYGIQVCEILEYLASLTPPVVHHDIKPANIIVDASANRARLVDFGIAKARLSAQPGGGVGLQKSSIYGTEGYAPPEQYNGQSEPRSDVYALAATLYHVVTNDDPGPHPFSFPQLSALAPKLRAALTPCLEDVRRRSSAADFRKALQKALVAKKSDTPGARDSFAVVNFQAPSAANRLQLAQRLQQQLGLTAAAAEVLTWQEPVSYLRGVDARQAQALLAQLAPYTINAKAVRTSQLLSWRAGLTQQQQQRLADTGELVVNQPYYPQDSVCHCYACGHEWKTRATDLARLRASCSQCGSAWHSHRIFRCTVCGHEFAHGDCVTDAPRLFPQCPACQARAWLPRQQLQLSKSPVTASLRLPVGAVKLLHLALPAKPNPATLRGRVIFSAPWIIGGEQIANGQVELTVNAAGLQPRQTLRADGWAITNGGSAPVSIDLYVDAPPQLVIASTALDFGLVKAQETRTLDLVIRNGGDGDLNGRIVSSSSWLHIDKDAFQGKQAVVKCRVNGADLYQPGVNAATLTVESNGGRQSIPVTAVALPTTLAVDPPVIDFGHRPRRGMAHAQLTVINAGLGLLEGDISSDVSWISLDAGALSGNANVVRLTVKLTDLSPGSSGAGRVLVRSNGGAAAIPVHVRVSRHGVLGHMIRYSRATQILLALLVLLGAGYGWWQAGRVERAATSAHVAPTQAAAGGPGAATIAAGNASVVATIATITSTQTIDTRAAEDSTMEAPSHRAAVDMAAATAAAARPLPTNTVSAMQISIATATPAPPTASAETSAPIMRPICTDPRANITSPAPGIVVSGRISVTGTALHEVFDYYKLEYMPGIDPAGSFIFMFRGNAPVVNGTLAEFNTAALPNGVYTLRLTVVDASGNYPPPCTVTIRISN